MTIEELRRIVDAAPMLRASGGQSGLSLSCIPAPGTTEGDMYRAAVALINEGAALLAVVEAAVEVQRVHDDRRASTSEVLDAVGELAPVVRAALAALEATP